MNLEFHFWITLILIAIVMGVVQTFCAFQIYMERKISAYIQDRYGPNRVGPGGIFQSVADGLKMLFKEEVIPSHVDKLFYLMAPAIAISAATLALAVVPFGRTMSAPERPWPQTVAQEQARDADPQLKQEIEEYNNTIQFVIAPHVDIGIVFVFAIGSLAVYAIVLGGWSSNNKYSFLGSLRSSAQLISYEIPLGMSALGVFLMTGSLNVERMIDYQVVNGWNFIFQPLACILFITSIFAECNRLPFDLPEAEQELVGGYHTEYSALKFGLFFLGEYTHMVTTSFLAVALFFGGWHLPFITDTGNGGLVLKLIIFSGKMFLFICFYMLIRWTIPRFRFDQLMGLAWKVMMPLALLNLIFVLIVKQLDWNHWWLLPISVAVLVGFGAVALLLPRPTYRRPIEVRGHPIGQPALVGDRAGLR
jgi:NADH-quinone oxidoreductase subunit H